MNIVIFEHALTRVKGGMEKVPIDIANAMQARGHNVHLIADNKNPDARPVFDYDPHLTVSNIDVAGMDITYAVLAILKQFGADVFLFVFASNNYLSPFYEVFKRCHTPIVFSEHNSPDFLYKNSRELAFRNAILSMGDRIHLLLDEYSTSLPPLLKQRFVAIGNPVMPALRDPVQQQTDCPKKILYVGRINNKPKQINLLVDAFKILAKKFPGWSLEIWGHGPHEEELRNQIKSRGLKGRAFFCGKSNAMDEVYASGNILCLPSLFEGFPLVVGEAHSYGLPVVGFSSCSGVNSLVQHGKNGLLVEEISASSLAEALEKLMGNDALRVQMGQTAVESVKCFSPDIIFEKWEGLLRQASTLKVVKAKEFDPAIMPIRKFRKIKANKPFWPYYENNIFPNWRIAAPLRWISKKLQGH